MTVNNPAYYSYRPTKLKVSRLGINISDEMNQNLNLDTTEYMVVGEHFINHGGYTSNTFSLIVDNEGIAVNSRLDHRRSNIHDYAVELYGNTYLDGNLIVTGIISTGLSSNSSGGSSNFWKYGGNNNIYYNGNITLGNYLDALDNTYTVNISDSANKNIDKAQLAIQNRKNSVLRMSILGDGATSPIIFNTSNVPIEFHVGRNQQFFDNLYRQSYWLDGNYYENVPSDIPKYEDIYHAPHLNIDVHGNVGIRTNENKPLRYILRERNPQYPDMIIYPEKYEPANLHIEGTTYSCNLLIFDYESAVPKNIDELYIRKLGVTFAACNIAPGDFARGNFIFHSNVAIFGPIDDSRMLKVYGHTEVTSNIYVQGDVVSYRDIVGDSLYIHNSGSFSNNIVVQNNIYFKANLFKQRTNLQTGSNEWEMILFDDRFFEKPTLSNIFYIGDGIATIGRLGVGINPTFDEVNHQLTVTKRDPSFYELELMDKSTYGYKRAAYIGHPTTSFDYRSDGSLVFLTPGVRDNNYNKIYTNGEQNFYFYPGFNQRLSQFRIEACNVPTFGIFVNNRVGVKTFSPTHELDVNGDIATSGNYYIKLKNELQPIKLGIWRDNNYSFIVNGGPDIYKGIQYYNPEAPHVGINTIATSGYGVTVAGKMLSIDGYYTSDGNRIVPFFNSSEIFTKPTPPYESVYLNGKVGIGVVFPRATMHIRETNNGSTSIKLSQSSTSVSTYLQMSGNHSEYMFHLNDDQNTFELMEGISNQIYDYNRNKPWLILKRPNNTYQTVINSNMYYATTNPSDSLLVNGNIRVAGDVNITGTYHVNGAAILIAGSQAQFFQDNISPENIYIAGENIYMNTRTPNYGAIFIGWGGNTAIDFPAEVSGTDFDKSVFYVRQKDTVSAFVTKYESKGYYCLSQYKDSRNTTAVIGITNRNAFFIGNTVDLPYITVQDLGGNRNTVGIGTNNPYGAKFQVFTPDQQSVAKLTHYSGAPDVDDFVADITLEKIVNGGDDIFSWSIQGPNSSYRQKLQFIYTNNLGQSNEALCITSDGCIGIGNPQPLFAIDIASQGDKGSIRMLQSDPMIAKPQLVFQSGSNQYGADMATDYRMYSFQNNFYLDMQDIQIGEKVLLHFTSNNSMGVLRNADDRYGMTLGGSLNVKGDIYINDRPFFSVGDSIQDLGTFLQGYNIFLNPQISSGDPKEYGGVVINGVQFTSNVFQVNSGLNGNTGVFNSEYLQSLVYYRNTINPITKEHKIWRVGNSNTSYIMEYRSNLPVDELFITDQPDNYARAYELVQTAVPGEFIQRIQGSIDLHARNPEIIANNTSRFGVSNENIYLMTSNFGIGTIQPLQKVHIYNTEFKDSLLIEQLTSTCNIIQIRSELNKTRIVVNGNGNVGIGTTIPRSDLEVVGQVFLSDGSSLLPSYSFSSASNSGMYVGSDGSIHITNNSSNVLHLTTNGKVGVSQFNPRGKVDILSSNLTEPTLVLSQYTNENILEAYSNTVPKLVINSLGNLGIGTTLPQYGLHVVGTVGMDASILPNQDAVYTLGSVSNRWKDLYLSGSSLYLDDLRLSKYNTDKVSVTKNGSLTPIVTNSIFLDTLDNNSVILTKDPDNVANIPMFITSNTSTNTNNQYTPIVYDKTNHVTGVGTYTPLGYLHVYSSNNPLDVSALYVTQKTFGDVVKIEGDFFRDKTNNLFNMKITSEGYFGIAGEPNTGARVTIADYNSKTVLYLDQKNTYQDILQLAREDVTRTVFNNNGYLGIGTLAPACALHIEGKSLLNAVDTTSPALSVYGWSGFTSNVYIGGETEISGDLVVHGYYINDSDRRIKYNIQPIESALEKVKKLSGYTFTKLNKARRETGVIAQEVKEVLPEAVYENTDGTLGVAYGNLVGLLIESIKELSTQMEEIKQKLK